MREKNQQMMCCCSWLLLWWSSPLLSRSSIRILAASQDFSLTDQLSNQRRRNPSSQRMNSRHSRRNTLAKLWRVEIEKGLQKLVNFQCNSCIFQRTVPTLEMFTDCTRGLNFSHCSKSSGSISLVSAAVTFLYTSNVILQSLMDKAQTWRGTCHKDTRCFQNGILPYYLFHETCETLLRDSFGLRKCLLPWIVRSLFEVVY